MPSIVPDVTPGALQKSAASWGAKTDREGLADRVSPRETQGVLALPDSTCHVIRGHYCRRLASAARYQSPRNDGAVHGLPHAQIWLCQCAMRMGRSAPVRTRRVNPPKITSRIADYGRSHPSPVYRLPLRRRQPALSRRQGARPASGAARWSWGYARKAHIGASRRIPRRSRHPRQPIKWPPCPRSPQMIARPQQPWPPRACSSRQWRPCLIGGSVLGRYNQHRAAGCHEACLEHVHGDRLSFAGAPYHQQISRSPTLAKPCRLVTDLHPPLHGGKVSGGVA